MELIVTISTLDHGVITGCGTLGFLIMDTGKYVLVVSKHIESCNEIYLFLIFIPIGKTLILLLVLGDEVSSFKCKMVAGGIQV